MKKALIVRPDAELDLAEAYSWYEARVSGLGSDFLLSIDASLSSIQRTPEMSPIVYKNVRRGLVRRFPYGIFYVVEEDRIVILGILHARRDPKTWQDRA
jgi:toxin ParE1/3/4